jgi:hypothetical protein
MKCVFRSTCMGISVLFNRNYELKRTARGVILP